MAEKTYWVNPKATPEGLWGGSGSSVPAGMKPVTQAEQQAQFAQQRAKGIEQERWRSNAVNYTPGAFASDVSKGAVSIGNTAVTIEPIPDTKPGEIPAKVEYVLSPAEVTTRTVGTQGTTFRSITEKPMVRNQEYDIETMKAEAKKQGLDVTSSGEKTIITAPIDYAYQWRGKEIKGSAGFTELFQKRMEEEQQKQEKEMVAKFGKNWRMSTVSPGVAEVAGLITPADRKEAEETGGMFVVPKKTLQASAIAKERGEPIPVQQEYLFPKQAKRMEDISKALVEPVAKKERVIIKDWVGSRNRNRNSNRRS